MRPSRLNWLKIDTVMHALHTRVRNSGPSHLRPPRIGSEPEIEWLCVAKDGSGLHGCCSSNPCLAACNHVYEPDLT